MSDLGWRKERWREVTKSSGWEDIWRNTPEVLAYIERSSDCWKVFPLTGSVLSFEFLRLWIWLDSGIHGSLLHHSFLSLSCPLLNSQL